MLTTIAIGIMLESYATIEFGAFARPLPSPGVDKPIIIFGAGVFIQELLIPFVAVLIVVLLGVFQRRTQLGRAMRAVAFNRVAAGIVGINVLHVAMFSFALASALGGLAGILVAPVIQASATMGLLLGIKGFAVAIIGGITSAPGVVIAGLLYGIIEKFVDGLHQHRGAGGCGLQPRHHCADAVPAGPVRTQGTRQGMSRIARHFNPAFVVAAAILILALPHIAANEYELRLITLLLIYAIIALGLNVLVGLTGLVSLGQAGLYAIGAYTAAILATRLGVGLVPGLILGMALAGAFGVLLAYPTVRVRGVYLAVVTIAFGIIVENVAIEWDSLTGSWVGISNYRRRHCSACRSIPMPISSSSGRSALIAFLVNLNLMNSRFGRAMRATAQSEIASRSLGINVVAIRTLAFVVSAMAAGAAGVFYVYLNKYISPDIFSFTDSIRFLLMVILGGSGTALGPVVGASIMTYLPEYLQAFGPWQAFAYGLLLAAVMFVCRAESSVRSNTSLPAAWPKRGRTPCPRSAHASPISSRSSRPTDRPASTPGASRLPSADSLRSTRSTKPSIRARSTR